MWLFNHNATYDNKTISKNLIKNSQLDYLDVSIYDDNNNLIDFNGIEWNIVLEIETTLQVQQNIKTIDEYLGELYSNNQKLYYLNGLRYSKEEWFELLAPEQKITALYNEENW